MKKGMDYILTNELYHSHTISLSVNTSLMFQLVIHFLDYFIQKDIPIAFGSIYVLRLIDNKDDYIELIEKLTRLGFDLYDLQGSILKNELTNCILDHLGTEQDSFKVLPIVENLKELKATSRCNSFVFNEDMMEFL